LENSIHCLDRQFGMATSQIFPGPDTRFATAFGRQHHIDFDLDHVERIVVSRRGGKYYWLLVGAALAAIHAPTGHVRRDAVSLSVEFLSFSRSKATVHGSRMDSNE
jgi:hypothetical protein